MRVAPSVQKGLRNVALVGAGIVGAVLYMNNCQGNRTTGDINILSNNFNDYCAKCPESIETVPKQQKQSKSNNHTNQKKTHNTQKHNNTLESITENVQVTPKKGCYDSTYVEPCFTDKDIIYNHNGELFSYVSPVGQVKVPRKFIGNKKITVHNFHSSSGKDLDVREDLVKSTFKTYKKFECDNAPVIFNQNTNVKKEKRNRRLVQNIPVVRSNNASQVIVGGNGYGNGYGTSMNLMISGQNGYFAISTGNGYGYGGIGGRQLVYTPAGYGYNTMGFNGGLPVYPQVVNQGIPFNQGYQQLGQLTIRNSTQPPRGAVWGQFSNR